LCGSLGEIAGVDGFLLCDAFALQVSADADGELAGRSAISCSAMLASQVQFPIYNPGERIVIIWFRAHKTQ
jgi:hypothetical protein